MLSQVASRSWKSRVVLVGVMSIGTSCGGIDQEEQGIDVAGDSVAALTAGTVTSYEAENLTRTASTIGSKVTADAAASGGKYVEFNGTANQAGSWIQFLLPNIAAGPYSLTFLYKANFNRGIIQASIDGTDLGAPCNEYAATAAYQVVCSLGDKTLSSGNHTIRFRVTGKSGSSAGYQLVVDKIALTFKGQCTSVADCGAGYQACVSNKCVCRQKSANNLLTNPNFDGSLSGWGTSSGAPTYTSADADGCPGSGSAATNTLADVVSQCVRVNANTRYYVGVRYQGPLHCYVLFHGGTTCDFANAIDTGSMELVDAQGLPGSWASKSLSGVSPPGATSARVACSAVIGRGPYDQLYLNPVSNSF